MKNVCVFIDLNKSNYNFKAFEDAINKLQNKGQIVFGKLYNFSPVKHKEYLEIIRKLDFETAPETALTLNKRNKDILDIREIVDILNFVNSETKTDIIYLITCDGNVVPVLKALKVKNLYVIGSYDYEDKDNMDMCNEIFDYNLFRKKIVTAKKAPQTKVVKKPEPIKKAEKTKAGSKKQIKKSPVKKTASKPVAKKVVEKKTEAKTTKIITTKAFDLKRLVGESEEEYFIRMLNAFAQRTNKLNFEYNKDIQKKQELLADIEKFVKQQKAVQNGKKKINPEIMSVIRELGNLASDIKATIELNDDKPDEAMKIN